MDFAGILAAFVISSASFIIGRKLISRISGLTSLEIWCCGGGIGLGLLAYAVLALGLLNLLTPFALCFLVLFVAAFAVFFLFQDLKNQKINFQGPVFFAPVFNLMLAGGIGIIFLSAVTLLAPEVEGDALCYHLHLPRLFLASHTASAPYEINAWFPLLVEMLYTLGLGIANESSAKAFHFVLTLLSAGGVFCCLKRLNIARHWNMAAVIIYLTTPGILNQAPASMVDNALAAYAILIILVIMAGLENSSKKIWVLAGILSGFAMSVKYTAALFIIPAAAGLFILPALQKKYKSAFTALFLYSAAAFAASFFWYLRSWIQTGNPVFPQFAQVFGTGNFEITYEGLGIQKNLLNFFTCPWWLTVAPEKFTGYAEQIGPAYLLFLPFLAFYRPGKNRTLVLFLGLITVFFYTAWFLLAHVYRFLFPLVPALAVWLGISLQTAEDRLTKSGCRIVMASLLACLLIHGAFVGYHFRRFYPLVFGQESRDTFLKREERTWGLAAYINQNLPVHAKIMNADEIHLFRIHRKVVRDSAYAIYTRYETKFSTPEQVTAQLKKEGFTHFLLAVEEGLVDKSQSEVRINRFLKDPEIRRRLGLERVYKTEHRSPEGRSFDYELFRL